MLVLAYILIKHMNKVTLFIPICSFQIPTGNMPLRVQLLTLNLLAPLCVSLPFLVKPEMLTPILVLKHIMFNNPLKRPVVYPHYVEEEYGNLTFACP